MIHYHGLPITPESAAVKAIDHGHAFVSFRAQHQLGLAIEIAQSFAVDNGAFGAWRSGLPVTDWEQYYEWVESLRRIPNFDFAIIPDEIEGDEKANDALLDEWPWRDSPAIRGIGVPVWHLHESLDRLARLCADWPRVAFGSSGQFATVGNKKWWGRISEAFDLICCDKGLPASKIHGLRMLNPEVFSRCPFASVDSTNIARNVGIDSAWRGTYTPTNKDTRAAVMRARIEGQPGAAIWSRGGVQMTLDIYWPDTNEWPLICDEIEAAVGRCES